MKIIRYTIFNSNPFGNGAEKRTAQVTEILKNYAVQSIYVKKINIKRISAFRVLIYFFPVILKLRKIIPLNYIVGLKSLFRQVRNYLLSLQELKYILKSDVEIFLWECTRNNNFFIPILVKQFDKKVIALPHNIESLVPNQKSTISKKIAPHWFNEELLYLSKSDFIFCISKEETMLLKLFGIDSYYLPYFPEKETEASLLKIRLERQKKKSTGTKKNILMLGSANNQPTLIGMLDRISFFKENLQQNVILKIAGFSTEALTEGERLPEQICNLGTLKIKELELELINTDAILIHQQASTGALTRIIEMLIAGIPIIANFESSREYHNLNGIYTYYDDLSMLDHIYKNFDCVPEIPRRPIEHEKRFIEVLNLIHNKG